MSEIGRSKLVHGIWLGCLAGPIAASFGKPSQLHFNAFNCLHGAMIGLTIAWLIEARAGQHSHRAVLNEFRYKATELRKACCALDSETIHFLIRAPRRTRLSLRMFLMVVAVSGTILGWVGHNVRQNLQRDAVLNDIVGIAREQNLEWFLRLAIMPPRVPEIVLGDYYTDADWERIHKAFPEATIVICPSIYDHLGVRASTPQGDADSEQEEIGSTKMYDYDSVLD